MIRYSKIYPTRTTQAMDIMLQNHKPKYWIFGHHHRPFEMNIDGCIYKCLDEFGIFEI